MRGWRLMGWRLEWFERSRPKWFFARRDVGLATAMPRYLRLMPFYFLLLAMFSTCRGQSTPDSKIDLIPVVVGTAPSGGDAVIAIPPATSWSGTINFAKPNGESARPGDISDWMKQQGALNGMQGINTPWHIIISYDQFEGDGDNVHSGVFEELWDGPKKYVISYKADDLKQTDYATDHGLYRSGDQKWPNRAQRQVSDEVMNPFEYATTLRGVSIRNASQAIGSHVFNCAFVENGPGRMASPTQYCFEPAASQLRYVRGGGWYQTAYNDLISFEGRFVGRTVAVYDGGKPYLKLHVELLEPATNKTDADLLHQLTRQI